MLELINAVICESITEPIPVTLERVRKRWRTPPETFWIYLEVLNPSESPYSLNFELWRGGEFIASTDPELIPSYDRVDEHTAQLSLNGLEPKTYILDVLLDGTLEARIGLDFGHPEAP